MHPSRPFGFLIVCLWLAASARADVRVGFGATANSYLPIDTYYSDSRFQFIIPREELRLEAGEVVSAIDLYLASSQGAQIEQMVVRMRNVGQVQQDSLTAGRFINGGLTTCASGSLPVFPTPGWLRIYFTANHTLNSGGDVLVDLVMNKSAAGTDSYWSSVVVPDAGLAYGVTNTNASFNLLGQATGSTNNRRPLLRLVGVDRLMPAIVVDAAQLNDPDGQIHADWKVAGRRTSIRPGVTLTFAEGYGLRVRDSFQALGVEGDSIRFTGTRWNGIEAVLPAGKLVEMSHCVVENGAGRGFGISQPSGGLRNRIRDCRFGNCANTTALLVADAEVELERIRCHGSGVGLELQVARGRFEDITVDHCGSGVWSSFSNLVDESALRRLRIHECSASGLGVDRGAVQLVNGTLTNCQSKGVSASSCTVELVNCVLINPAASQEIWSEYFATTMIEHSLLWGGRTRCATYYGGQLLFGAQLLDEDPVLDGEFRPMEDSPLVDAGSPLTELDPDLTRADIGCYWHDQSAPLALGALDVPEDQGHQLQLSWQPSSMDLAQANAAWYYSLWRLDPLFDAAGARSGLPVVSTRRQAEAAIAQGEPFLWERDGHVWHFLGSVPAARHATYAQVVETLADRQNGLPWTSQLKVLWHAGTVLSESAIVLGTSVDNVPPDAPAAVATRGNPETGLELVWPAVTTGTLNGARLAERNAIRYRVLASANAYAPAATWTPLAEVDSPTLTLPWPEGNSQRFFKVVALDD